MGEHTGRAARPRAGRLALLLGLVLVVAAGVAVYARVDRGSDGTARPAGPDPCSRQPIALNVGAETSAMSWLAPLLDEYAAARRTVDGRCVKLTLRELPSEQVRQQLQPAPGDTPPDIWIPESTTSVDLIRVQLRPEIAKMLEVPEPSVASSPIVLALPTEALHALAAQPGAGTPQLAGLLGLARNPTGWAAVGRPDWGPIRFSTVDPGNTTLGANLVVAAVGALTGTAAGEVRATAFNKVDARAGLFGFVRTLVSAPANAEALFAAVGRASTTEEMLNRIGVLAVYEKDVWRHNGDSPAVLLRALYPFGGQLAADYPFVVPNASWVEPADRAAAADVLGWLQTEQVQSRLSAFGLRRASGLAGPELEAAEHGLSDLPVQPEGPRSPDGAAAAQSNWRLINRPMSVLAMLDVSGSMGDPVPGTARTKLDYATAAAQTSLGFLAPRDAVGLWDFSRELDGGRDYRELVPLGTTAEKVGAFPDRRAALATAYRTMVPRTGTGLYDSVLAGYRNAAARHRPGYVNMVLVVTDGRNEDPDSISVETLVAELRRMYDKRRPVHIVTLAYGADADRAVLGRMARATEGLEFAAVDPRSISDVFIAAVSSLNS